MPSHSDWSMETVASWSYILWTHHHKFLADDSYYDRMDSVSLSQIREFSNANWDAFLEQIIAEHLNLA